MSRLLRLCAALLLPALLLTGCWQDTSGNSETLPAASAAASSSEEAPAEQTSLPGSFSLPYYANVTLDPLTCPDGDQQTVAALLYEGLYELDEHLAPQPKLCTGGSWDAAALTWTFALRSGVTFSDGSALTAEDCAAGLRRAMTSSRYGARLAGVKSVAASNGAVVVTLTAANANLPALLDIPIVKAGTESNLVPIGTGPYQFLTDDSGPALTPNTHWWGGSAQPVQRIGLLACQDADAVRYQFTSHSIQLISADLTGSTPVSTTGSFSFQDADTTILQYVGFNTRRTLFADAAVRKALSLGIDRENLVSANLSGHGKAAQFPVSPASALYPSDLESKYAYTSFQEALAAAGLTSGKERSVTLIVNSENSFKVSVAQSIAASLSDSDLNVTVRQLSWTDYVAALHSGSYDLYLGEVKLTADWDLRPLLATGGSLNYGGFSDATLDLLLAEYNASGDQKAAMNAVCAYLKKQAPILPICFKSVSVLTQAGVVDGLNPTAANPFYELEKCSIHLSGS